MKKVLFILIYIFIQFLCYSREIDFEGFQYHYFTDEKIRVINKTKGNVDFSIYGKIWAINADPLHKIIDISTTPKTKKFFTIEDNIFKGPYRFLRIFTENDFVTFEISTIENYLNIIILDRPSYEQIQKYPHFSQSDQFSVYIDENITYKFNCLYILYQKNDYSEAFKRYICFYDYELGKGEKGTTDYIKYKYKLICMPCFTTDQLLEIQEKGKQLYFLNEEHKKRLQENIDLNTDDLNYQIAGYSRISTFSRNGTIGKKYIADSLNYYEVSYIGNDNYDIRGTYSRAVFHCPTGISHFTMIDNQRIVTYLGNIEVIRKDGVLLSVPYYECSDELPAVDPDIETLINRKGDWQREVFLTPEVREILK